MAKFTITVEAPDNWTATDLDTNICNAIDMARNECEVNLEHFITDEESHDWQETRDRLDAVSIEKVVKIEPPKPTGQYRIPVQKVSQGGKRQPKTCYTFHGIQCHVERAGSRHWEGWVAGEDHTTYQTDTKREMLDELRAECFSRSVMRDACGDERPF